MNHSNELSNVEKIKQHLNEKLNSGFVPNARVNSI